VALGEAIAGVRSEGRGESEGLPEPRFLRAEVAAKGRRLERAFLAGVRHRVAVSIGPDEGGLRVSEGFPEETLPDASRGHMLGVVFFAPALMEQPEFAGVYLPESGASEPCEFGLIVPNSAQQVEARVTVLHENRVIQSAVLHGPVRRHVKEACAPAESPGEDTITFTVAHVTVARADLGERSRFAGALVLNHVGETPGALAVRGNRSVYVRLDEADTRATVQQFDAQLARGEWDLEEFKDLRAKGTTDLLRNLAWLGCALYQNVIERLGGNFAAGEKVQIVSTVVSARLPFEFVYDQNAPSETALVCDTAEEVLKQGGCPGCKKRDENPSSVICPFGFWCTSRVVEWHAFSEEHVEAAKSARFVLETADRGRTGQLRVLQNPLVGYSDKVTQALPESINELTRAFEQVGAGKPAFSHSWADWQQQVDALHPALEILLIHTEPKPPRVLMELGDAASSPMLATLNLKPQHLSSDPSLRPIVLLLGCSSGTSKVEFQGVAAAFEAKGAGVVVSTTSDVFGPVASKLAEYFVAQLGAVTDGQTFGDVMLGVRRRALAEGVPMVLCLRAYGDADWQLVKKDTGGDHVQDRDASS
jgi:hypothetical protein